MVLCPHPTSVLPILSRLSPGDGRVASHEKGVKSDGNPENRFPVGDVGVVPRLRCRVLRPTPKMNIFPYQDAGATFLSQRTFALLADVMGLGKTVQAILGAQRAGMQRILVVCPAIARQNWARELVKWGRHYIPYVLTVFGHSPPIRIPGQPTATILSFEYAVGCREKLRAAGPWDLIIIDEAHALKTPSTKRSKVILASDGIAETCGRVWALTGTPLTIHAGEIWNLAYTAGVTTLSHAAWCRKYCEEKYTGFGQGGQFAGSNQHKLDELHELLKESGWMLRRTTEDVQLELPPISYHDMVVEAGTVSHEMMQQAFENYDERRQEIADKLAMEQEMVKMMLGQPHLLSTEMVKLIEGLAQSVSTLRRITGMQKVHPVATQLEAELEADELGKVCIFCDHRVVIEILAQRLERFGVAVVYGGIGNTTRDQRILDFQLNRYQLTAAGKPSPRVYIGQYQASGTAINLQPNCHEFVALEIPWVGASYSQAIARLYRLGQSHSVRVRTAMLDNSMDQGIVHTLQRRAREISHILDGVPRELVEDAEGVVDPRLQLSEEQLKELILA